MRYSDEGNLKFSGSIRPSSVEPTPSQGYYRDELDYGKYSITLTNSEPGLGYFGFNEDELTYDIDNHALCTKNIYAEGDISADGNVSFDGNLSLAGNITSGGNASFDGTISSVGDIYSEGSITSEGNGLFEGDITSYSNATVSGNITSRGCIISGNNLSVSGNISATGNITAAKVNTPEIVLFDDGTCSNKIVKDANSGCIDIRISGYEGSSAEYKFNAHGQIHGIDVIQSESGTNTDLKFRTWDANECLCTPVTVKSTELDVAGQICASGDIYSEGNGLFEGNITTNEDAIVLCCLYVGGTINSTGNIHTSGTISSDFMELNANSINTSCACLLLNKPVCVPDIFTIGTGSSTQCHYIHTISLNGNSSASTDGTLNLGAAVTSATVNGITRTVDSNGYITLPNLTCSITVSGETCTVDSSGSITLPYLARCVAINGVSGCADATGLVDLGTLTAVLKVNLKGSAIIEDSSTICPDRIYNSVVIGKDAEPMNNTVDSCYNVFAGYNVKGRGCNIVAIGCGIEASEMSVAIGKGAYTYSASGNDTYIARGAVSIGWGAGSYDAGGIAIGPDAQSECVHAIAIGEGAEAGEGYSVALGCGAVVRGESGIAIGCEAVAECANSIAIGSSVNNNIAGGVYIGNKANAPSNSTTFRVSNIIKTDDTAHLSIFMHNNCTSIACYCFTYKDLVDIVTCSLDCMGILSQADRGVIGHGRVSYSCDCFSGDKTVNKEMNIFMNSNAQCVQYDGTWHSSSDTTVFNSNENMVGIWTLDLAWV